MQIKKTDWIGRPEQVKVRAHSLSFKTAKRCAALYTLEENEELRLIRHNKSVSFLMLHTKEDRIIFKDDFIDLKFFSLRETITKSTGDVLLIEKRGKSISFSTEGGKLMEIENEAFTSSASFGFLIEPSDEEILLELF